jgi:hypothetical protein
LTLGCWTLDLGLPTMDFGLRRWWVQKVQLKIIKHQSIFVRTENAAPRHHLDRVDVTSNCVPELCWINLWEGNYKIESTSLVALLFYHQNQVFFYKLIDIQPRKQKDAAS